MGPIAELAAPLLAPMLQPIMQDVEKAVGGIIGQAGQGIQGLISQAMQSFNPLQALMGGFQNQGLCPASPNPFTAMGFQQGIFNNPVSSLGNLFAPQGSSGYTNPADALTPPGPNWSTLNQNLQNAAASGDPNQMRIAQDQLDQYNQWEQMMSAISKAQHDTDKAIIQNISA
jgi:hypothetical protein